MESSNLHVCLNSVIIQAYMLYSVIVIYFGCVVDIK